MSAQSRTKESFNGAAAAQEAAARLSALNLEAEKLCAALAGLHKKDKAGAGTDFHSFRPFASGIDNPRKIDWKASARRLDQEGHEILLVRNREEEVCQTLYLWCDQSRSMDFRAPAALFPAPPAHTKKEAALTLALAVAHLADQASESFALLGSATVPGRGRPMIDAIMLELAAGDKTADAGALPQRFTCHGKAIPPGSHVFLFSDFLHPLSDIAALATNLRHAGAKGHLIQILDPAEMDFRYSGHIALRGMEGESPLRVKKAESAKEEADARIRRHIRDIDSLVKKLPGWHYSLYPTDKPLYEALLPLYGIRPNLPASPAGARP